MPGGDPGKPKPNLIYADTLKDEVLPSTRPNFVQYNSHYRAKGFYDLLDEVNAFVVANKKAAQVYLFPLVWSSDSINCREAQMFHSPNFPNFKYGNTITNVDPKWTDSKIYQHETNFIAWTKPATYIHAIGEPSTNYPSPTEWPQWWWIPSGDLSNNSVWPVFDGTYTDAQTLKGSIEKNVPLGDLNWYPAAKSAFMAKHAEIWAHMKAGNTGQIDIGYLTTGVKTTKADAFSIYPNPAKDVLKIKGAKSAEVTFSTLDGRKVKTVENASEVNISGLANGTYIVTIKEGKNVSTQKLLIQK
jgi:hypothetical protein